MSTPVKILLGCGVLIALGFLMVGAMVAFGLMISRPEQRRLDSRPRTSAPTNPASSPSESA